MREFFCILFLFALSVAVGIVVAGSSGFSPENATYVPEGK